MNNASTPTQCLMQVILWLLIQAESGTSSPTLHLHNNIATVSSVIPRDHLPV